MPSTTGQSAYGGVRRYQMTAPAAPNPQGAALAGQNRVTDQLTAAAQQTMGVPRTPVKGLLNRMVPTPQGQMARMPGSAMPNMPGMPGRKYVRSMG